MPDDIQSEIRKQLEQQYGVADPKATYRPDARETSAISVALQWKLSQQSDEAEAAYEKLVSSFPASPLARAEYAQFLLERGRSQDAERLVESSLEDFPDDLKLRILKDTIAQAAGQTSRSLAGEVTYRFHLLGL